MVNAPRRPMRRSSRPKYIPKRKVCAFCVDKVDDISYKDVALLRRYVSERCRIEPRRRTGTCAKHQRALAQAIKRARYIALIPHTPAQMRKVGVTSLRG
jgi:small subunit ribosomal protein S18